MYVVSCFTLHFVLYRGNFDYFLDNLAQQWPVFASLHCCVYSLFSHVFWLSNGLCVFCFPSYGVFSCLAPIYCHKPVLYTMLFDLCSAPLADWLIFFLYSRRDPRNFTSPEAKQKC